MFESTVNKRASGKRSKKRKFSGNQYTHERPVKESTNESTSAKKLNNSCFEESECSSAFLGYRLIDIFNFCSEIVKSVCCKMCGSDVEIKEAPMYGLQSKFIVHCSSCKEIASFKSSVAKEENPNQTDINTRFIYAMRCLGTGWAGMNTFCSVMDLPPPLQKTSYTKILKTISSAVSSVACHSMKSAGENEIKLNGDSKLTISGDGSWKTRGHASQIGLTSIIGVQTGKVLDIQVMSSFCKGCSAYREQKNGPAYEKWKEQHQSSCIKNHTGSSGKMEVEGMLEIFHRSEEKHSAQYINYIGDGDTKTFLELQKSNVYGSSIKISKIECVGHVQKRMGTRLRNLKKNMQGKKLSDGKPLSGKGRLTDNVIDSITIFYGNAIRSNKISLIEMRKAIWAIYYHKRSTDAEPLHDFCPTDKNSWCKYQLAKLVGKEKSFKHKNVLPSAVMDSIKPIFKDLSDPALLQRCLGGRTQNPNESFNSLVWKFCPKTSGSSRIIADIAANEAVIQFNEGRKGRIEVMKSLGLKIGQYALDAANKYDWKRVQEAERFLQEASLEERKAKRRKLLIASKKEDTAYKAGNF